MPPTQKIGKISKKIGLIKYGKFGAKAGLKTGVKTGIKLGTKSLGKKAAGKLLGAGLGVGIGVGMVALSDSKRKNIEYGAAVADAVLLANPAFMLVNFAQTLLFGFLDPFGYEGALTQDAVRAVVKEVNNTNNGMVDVQIKNCANNTSLSKKECESIIKPPIEASDPMFDKLKNSDECNFFGKDAPTKKCDKRYKDRYDKYVKKYEEIYKEENITDNAAYLTDHVDEFQKQEEAEEANEAEEIVIKSGNSIYQQNFLGTVGDQIRDQLQMFMPDIVILLTILFVGFMILLLTIVII